MSLEGICIEPPPPPPPGQMDNIFQYGCYIVGSAKSHICQHYHEVIRLTLKAKDKPLTKTSYNLEELRDLESKLVLITGPCWERSVEPPLIGMEWSMSRRASVETPSNKIWTFESEGVSTV